MWHKLGNINAESREMTLSMESVVYQQQKFFHLSVFQGTVQICGTTSRLFSKLKFCRAMTLKLSAKHYHSRLQNGGDLDPENELEKLESSSDISSQEQRE